MEILKEEFFSDISNYIPLGSLFLAAEGDESENGCTHDFEEKNLLPTSFTQISTLSHRNIKSLCNQRLVRIFTRKQDDGTTHTRVYVLPHDVGRSFVERQRDSHSLSLLELIGHLNNSHEAWEGCECKETLYDLMSKDDDSLFYLFNQIPSPTTSELSVSCPYSTNAIYGILGPGHMPGIKTSLYPYQKRTVVTMIRREVQPARALDPRLRPLTSPSGAVFYLDIHTGCILKHRREYDEACGGILSESMGLGKTLICLATILSTKGHWPSIPPEFSFGLHLVRPKVASLMETTAAAITRAATPWKPFFRDMLTSGEDYSSCQALLKKNAPCYEMPVTNSSRITRSPAMMSGSRTITLTSATLIIVPQNLLSQWKGEISRHIEEGELDVLCLDSAGKAIMPPMEQIQDYDIILITRQRLVRELVSSEKDDARKPFRYQSPLTKLHFLRVIMDEGHEFSSYGGRNDTYLALQKLQVDRKWIVSGTPSSGLMGVEVNAAALETIDATRKANMNHTAVLQRRRKEIALAQERKDLEKLGGLVVGFLKLKPWVNLRDDPALWSKYILPSVNGVRKPGSLQRLLESLVVRHRIKDIEVDLRLPPLYNRVVYLKPSWYDKVSINLFALALVANFITSERKDEDYMFHPKNKRFLNSLIMNLRQANFYWTSWTPEQVVKTVQASRTYLENGDSSETACSKEDRRLLEQAIHLGEIVLQCEAWKLLSQVQEMGIFVEDFPDRAQHTWTLIERKGTEPLMSGATQIIKAQEWMDDHINENENLEGIISQLFDIGTETTRKLWAKGVEGTEEPKTAEQRIVTQWAEENKKEFSRIISHKRPRSSPKSLTQKQTISGVRAPQQCSLDNEPASIKDSPLAKAKIIGTASAKLSYLIDQISQLHATEKILVFYEGDHIAYYIAQALELLSIRHLIYAGSLSSERQSAYVTTFNSTPIFRVLLMDVHHAAHGLHIASASRVFFVNPIWQPSVEAQAIKRAHRIGQTRPVYIETLVLEDTFEDKMLQRRKGMSAEEHQKAEKSLLDDDTMSTIIKNASFVPFHEHEIHNVQDQIAKLQTPQQLFLRPGRLTGYSDDGDADLIFPEGTPKKSRKRKASADMAASPRTPTKPTQRSSSPMMDIPMGTPLGGLPLRDRNLAADESAIRDLPSLFGRPTSPP